MIRGLLLRRDLLNGLHLTVKFTKMKYLCLFLVGIVFFSCTDKVIEKPDNLIPEDDMVNIYFDMSLFNASLNSGYDKFSEHSIAPTDYIYNKYEIDSLQLVVSGHYYAAKPALYEKIYERVEERLDSLKSHFDKEIGKEEDKSGKEPVKSDSLRLRTLDSIQSARRPSDSLQ